MADVEHKTALTEQIYLVMRLRWRILRNGLRQKSKRLDLLGLIISGTFATILVLGLCFAFYEGARAFLLNDRPGWVALLFWGIFVFWQGFPFFTAGFAANFEFRSLLRFPLKLSALYIIGLSYGLADFSAIASICWLIAMVAGAASANPVVLPSMIFVALLFLWMNLTMERLIGSWLERLLARRRSREIFFAVFILCMVSLQFIGPALQRYGVVLRPIVQRIQPYLSPLPPSLAGHAVAAAVQGHLNGVFLSMTGLGVYTLVFNGLLWLRFSAQYRGEEMNETAAPKATPLLRRKSANRSGHETWQLLPPAVAAILRKEISYLTRNGFSFFTLLMPPLLVILFSIQFTGTHPTIGGRGISAETFFPAMMAYLTLVLMSPAYNSFAFEGRGIQTYFTAPLRFQDVFLGKNLLIIVVLTLELGLCIIVVAYRVGLPSPPRFFATLAAMTFAIVGQLVIANWSSISFPRKLAFGQMRGQRQSGMAALLAFGIQILLAGMSTLIFLMGRWTRNDWLPTEIFVVLAAAAIGGYFASLEALTAFAEKKKEILIETLCR